MFRLYLYTFLIILFIVASLFPNHILFLFIGITANITIFVSLFHARGLYLYSGIIFYIVGVILFFINDLTLESFFLQFDSMLGMLSLFMVLPFLNSLILVGRYDKNLQSILGHKVYHLGDLYKRGGIVTHILGLFLNIATIPLLIQSLRNSLKFYSKKFTDKYYTKNLLRAYALCLMWSPMEIMIIKSLEITDSDYIIIVPFLIIFTSFMLYLDTTFGKRKYAHIPIENTDGSLSIHRIIKKIAELFMLLLLLVVAVTILNYIVGQGYLFSLVLLIIPISFIWAMKIRKMKRYIVYVIPNWKRNTMGQANLFFMFLTAGFFVNMVSETKVLAILQHIFTAVSTQTLYLYILIGLYFLMTAFIGFHPLVSIVLLAEILQPVLSEISSIPLAFVLIICSLSTVMYSPFNVSLSILSNIIKRNSFQVSFWNLPFSLFLITISIIFAYFMHFIFH